jgi:hypothetical protein
LLWLKISFKILLFLIKKAGSSKESSSIDRHGNDLIPPELIDADSFANNNTNSDDGPTVIPTPAPAAVVRLQHQQQYHMESLDSGSSPPSSVQQKKIYFFSIKLIFI